MNVKYYYSPSHNAFQRDDIIEKQYFFEDNVEITEKTYNEMLDGQSNLMRIEPDKKGNPKLVSIQSDTEDAKAEKGALIQEANDFVNLRQFPGKAALGLLSDEEKALYTKWIDYIEKLFEIDTTKAPDIEWPEKPL